MDKDKKDDSRYWLYLSHYINVWVSFTSSPFVLYINEMFTSSYHKHIKSVLEIVEDVRYFEKGWIKPYQPIINNFNHWFKMVGFLCDISFYIFTTLNLHSVSIISCLLLEIPLLNFKLCHFIIILLCVINQSLYPMRICYSKEIYWNITDKNFSKLAFKNSSSLVLVVEGELK
mgnify:CR=1 FL=1